MMNPTRLFIRAHPRFIQPVRRCTTKLHPSHHAHSFTASPVSVHHCSPVPIRIHQCYTSSPMPTHRCYTSSPVPVHRCYTSSTSSLPWSEILPYRSVKIDLVTAWREGWTPQDRQHFAALLNTHIHQWRGEGRSGVWLHLPLPLVHLANEAVAAGFSLHHVSHEEKSIVLSAWLEEGSANRLPRYASHHVGVSGVVYREDTEQVLVVQDKYKFVKWKFPGGLAEHSEDIGDAVVREVKEETGVDTEFRSVLAFRQHHHMPHYFDCSDLYFICRLHPLTFDLHPCEKEVVECQWMCVHDLATSEESTELSQRIARLIINNRHNQFSGVDITMETWPSVYKGHTYKLFLQSSSNQRDT